MPIIEGFTERSGGRSGGPIEGFQPRFVSDLEPKAPERTALGTLGDVGVMALKGAVGLPQAFAGLLDIPTGGRAGKFLEEVGYRPEETQKLLDTWYSDAQQAANEKVRSAEGFLPTVKAALQNPSTIVTAAGESVPQMLGGAGIARGIIKAAPKVAPWVAGAAGEGVLGAGSAASQIRAETEDGLLTPGQSGIAALSGLGTGVLGAAGGKLAQRLGLGDIDTALAQGSLAATGQRGLLRNVGGSAISEGVFEELPQSAQEQILQNIALDRPWDQGVGNAAAMGMLAGALPGAAGGYINNRAVEADLLRKQERDAAANAQYPKSDLPAGFFDRVNTDNEVGLGIVRPMNPYDAAGYVTAFNEGQDTELGSPQTGLFGTPPGIDQSIELPGAAPAAAPAPAAATIFAPDEQELVDMGVKPTPAVRKLWAQAKASGLSQNELDTIGSELGKNYGMGKKAFQAILVARNKPAAPAAPNAAAPAPAAAPLAPDVGTVTPTTATTPTAQATAGASDVATASPAAPVGTRKAKRVVNPAPLAQSQAFVAPDPVAVEEPAAAPASAQTPQLSEDEQAWEDSKPDDAPPLSALTPSLQQMWREARATKAGGRAVNLFKVAETLAAEQSDSAGSQEQDNDTLATLQQIFGERDAAMLYDRYVNNLTEEEIANKYGQSRQNVQKVTGEGELGRKTRDTKIKAAQKKYGWTDEYVQQLAARLAPQQAEAEVDSTGGRTEVDLEATESGFGVGAGQEDGGQDPSLREAGFSTSASLGGSVSNWRDTGVLAGRKDVSEADQAKLDALYARRAAAEEAGNDDAVEAADAEISQVETQYLTPGELAAKITQGAVDLQAKIERRQEQVAQARAAGKSSVSINNKLVPIEQVEQEAAQLQARMQEELGRAQEVLQRGGARKARGEAPKAEAPKTPKVRRVQKAPAPAQAAAPAAAPAPATPQTPAEQYASLVASVPGAPAFDDIPAKQRGQIEDLARRDQLNLAAVNRILSAPSPEAAPKADAPETPKVRRVQKAPSPEAAPKADARDSADSTSQRERDLRSKSRDQEQPGDVMLATTGKFVSLEDALEAARAAVASGALRPNAPFQYSAVLDIAPRDWNRMVQAMTGGAAAPKGAKFSKAAKSGGTTVDGVYAAIAKFFYRTPESFSSYVGGHIRVHQTEAQAVAAVKGSISAQEMQGAQGFVDPMDDRVVHLVADNISPGAELAVLLHEVGVHAGLLGRLGASFEVLAQQVRSWGKLPERTLERRVHDAAMARVAVGRLDGSIDDEVAAEELVAYATEEAVLAGVLPSDNASDRLSSWLGKLKRLIEAAFNSLFSRKIAMKALTAQNLVDFAKGAAEQHLQTTLIERGALPSASPAEVLQYYSKTTYGDEVFDDAKIEDFDEAEPGTEPVFWGAESSFGPHTAITTLAETISEGDAAAGSQWVSELNLYVTSAESRAIAKSTGNAYDAALQTISLRFDLDANSWSLAVFGPDRESFLFEKLKLRGQATELHISENGYVWTRLEGVPVADTVSMLAEARRRLTRALAGEVPAVSFERTTGAKPGKSGVLPASEVARRFSKAPRATQRLPSELQRPASTIANVLKDVGNKVLNVMTFTEDVINRAVDKGLAAAADLRRIYQERAQLTGRLEREVERIAQLYHRVPQQERGTGPGSANQFLYDSTREGKWGFKPDWRKTFAGTVDPAMKARYDALSKESKELVRAVFQHGDETLALKKKTVLEATNSEYDLLIKAANDRNDAKEAARLQADKVDQLKRFGTLFRLKEGSPYAPLKRFGDFVVIARSQAYLDADPKQRAEMESDATHYHVSFAESVGEARALTQQLQEQGAFAEVVMREKEAVQQSMFGGQLTAFNRLRKQLDQELDAATDDEAKAIRAARRVVGELYLTTLAEASARKAELKRKGVAGEIDMLRSFTTQGRADAHFIAGATYNERTLDVFNAMREQMKKGADQYEKSTIFNELMKRHTQSMEMDVSPLSAKLARVTSIYYLALSPGYYLTNLTQPWMMSLPVMAGRHNFLKAAGALGKAYADLAPMFRDIKLLEQFNLDKAPADVRRALTELTNRGRLDIGMDTELGEFKLEGEGFVKDKWNSFDRKLRNFAQRMESINRLATAIAAYRLEIAREGKADTALEYADTIISQTHGDYSATNAPRAFNTNIGRVALQFRKFQLIQLTLLAKLARESFTGKERAMAAKSLAYLLGQTALAAGAMGLPGIATIAWALKALDFGDDEPFDLEKELRDWIGNEELATVIARGVPAGLGVDLSGKLGMGNALALLPFNEVDLSTRAGYESALAALAGPAGGIGARLSDSVSLLKDGQYLRGMEQALPTGFANFLKSYRTATEGVTRRNGDELISPEEISAMDSFWQAIGFQPTKVSVRQFRDTVKRETDQKFEGRAQRIRNAYLRAQDDPEARAEARERWSELQDAREEAGYARQPLSSLLRAEQSQRKRERNTIEGIQFDPRTRRFVEDLVEE